MANLVLMLKDTVISEIFLEKDLISIGRSPSNDICIDNLAVSSCHAKISRRNNTFQIEDLNSTNGTFVNDKRVLNAILSNNDVIMIGKHSLIFSDPNCVDDQDITQNVRKGGDEETVMMSTKPFVESSTQQTDIIYEEPLGGFNVIEGPVESREYLLSARLTTIGKAGSSDIRLKGFFAPRVAALVNRGKEGYSLTPQSGGCKVLVNGTPVTGRIILKHCDIVDIWKVKLQFYIKN
jgi:pSer/pThr/pTyr-binding forkhead associated (FHA) protein